MKIFKIAQVAQNFNKLNLNSKIGFTSVLSQRSLARIRPSNNEYRGYMVVATRSAGQYRATALWGRLANVSDTSAATASLAMSVNGSKDLGHFSSAGGALAKMNAQADQKVNGGYMDVQNPLLHILSNEYEANQSDDNPPINDDDIIDNADEEETTATEPENDKVRAQAESWLSSGNIIDSRSYVMPSTRAGLTFMIGKQGSEYVAVYIRGGVEVDNNDEWKLVSFESVHEIARTEEMGLAMDGLRKYTHDFISNGMWEALDYPIASYGTMHHEEIDPRTFLESPAILSLVDILSGAVETLKDAGRGEEERSQATDSFIGGVQEFGSDVIITNPNLDQLAGEAVNLILADDVLRDKLFIFDEAFFNQFHLSDENQKAVNMNFHPQSELANEQMNEMRDRLQNLMTYNWFRMYRSAHEEAIR